MGPLYRMATWYKNALHEGKQCGGTLKRKDIFEWRNLFVSLAQPHCLPSSKVHYCSKWPFLQRFIRIQKKKLTWAIFYQIFKVSLSCLQILKKLIQWKRKQLQFLLKKVPTLNRHHSKINITHQNKISSHHLLIFDAKMLRAKGFFFFLLLLLIWILTLNLKWGKVNIGGLDLILTLVAEMLQSYATVCRGACLPASDSRT